MAQLPLPQRGQPISYSDLYALTDTVNEMNKIFAIKTSDSNFKGDDGVSQTQKTSQLLISAVYRDTNISQNVTTTTPVSVPQIPFDVTFKTPPVVIVTPVAKNSNKTSLSATAIVTNTTTSSVDVSLQFSVAGSGANVGLNVIAIGIASVN